MNALAKPAVGRYLNDSFVSTYQKVGTFTLAGDQKQGGNVAGYFCDPDGRVLHAIAGPVNEQVFLREARWALETHKLARLERRDDPEHLAAFWWDVHAQRLREEHGLDLTGRADAGKLNNQGRVHLLLAAAPLARLETVFKLVFEKILGEKISTAPVVQTARGS